MRALVAGATGMVGSWLSRRLIDDGTDVVALILDAHPQSELIRSRTIDRINVVNGALEDPRSVERAVTVQEVDTVFHLGAQTIVSAARPFDVESEAAGAVGVEPIVLDSATGEIRDQYLNSDFAPRELSWRARMELSKGLGRTVAWYAGLPAASHE